MIPPSETGTCAMCEAPIFRHFGVTGWDDWKHYSNGMANCWRIFPPAVLREPTIRAWRAVPKLTESTE